MELTQKPPNKTRFYKLKLFDVFVTGVAVEGDSASEWAKPVEHFTLNCGRLEWTYTEVDNGGRRLADIEADWDEATGQAGQRSSPLPPDTDSDGIPDEAELAMGLRVTEDDAAQDYDQDGLNNYQEFLAGTQPWNPDSVLKVTGILAVLDGELRASLTWNSTAGRVYDILASDWPAGPYRRVASVAATGETTSHVLAGPMNRRFFLLQLHEE